VLQDQITYDGYGNVRTETNAGFGDRWKFTGREFDRATGNQHNGERELQGPVGRWMQQDPWGFAAGDHNLYRYVGNGPTNAIDPTGLAEEMPVELIGGSDVPQGQLKGSSFPFAGGTGTVTVKTDTKAKVGSIVAPNSIALIFTLTGDKLDKGALADCHWLQFISSLYVVPKDGDDVASGYLLLGKKRLVPYGKALGVLDAKSTDLECPFYDPAGGTGRTKNQLLIHDDPSLPSYEDVKKYVNTFESYLISGKKVLYHVHWECESYDDKPHYLVKKITGERVNRLPYWALSPQFFAGYEDSVSNFAAIRAKKPLEYPLLYTNPIPEGDRRQWATQSAQGFLRGVSGMLMPAWSGLGLILTNELGVHVAGVVTSSRK
jgi:RHS repeat-associated protein